MSDVGDFFGGATDFLVGTSKDQKKFGKMSAGEIDRQADIENKIDTAYGVAGQQDASAVDFRQLLSNFISKDYGESPTPEQIAQASAFVDQTFTAPAQNVVAQNNTDYNNTARATAAAMGRNPNLDIATQQAMLDQTNRADLGIQAERGNRIAQETTGQFTRGLQQLQGAQQGSMFLTGLQNQAMANRLALLDAKSNVGNFFQNERANTGNRNTTTGALGALKSISSTTKSIAGDGASLYAMGQ